MTKKLLAIVLSMCMLISVFTGFSTVNAQEPETLVLFNESSYDGTYVRASLSFRNLSSDCVMYAGIYGENNVMKQVNKFTFQADSVDNIDIKIPAKNLSETDVVKIFFFDAQNGVKPLCKNISFSPMQSRTKLNGIIIGTCKYAYLYPNEVEFSIIDTYGNEDWAGTEFTTMCLKVAEGLNADKYFGITVDIYLNITSKNTYEIAEIVPDGYSEVLSLNVSNIDSVDYSSINYYPTETSTKSVQYKLDSAARYYNNYMWVQSVNDIICDHNGMIKSDADLELTLIENTGDSIYDLVIGKEYGYDIVTYVDGERSRFETDSGKLFTFDFEDTDILSDITNSDGEAITLSDIKEGDVIAWMSDNYSTNCASYSWIEVINLGNNTVSGTVDGISGDKIRVDGTAYTDISGINLQLGDEGIFYLTLNKKIFYFKYNSNENYAYILNAAINSTYDENVWLVRLLTTDNKIIDYPLADDAIYDGYNYPNKYSSSFPLNNFAGNYTDNMSNRIISYKLNSDEYIKEINTAQSSDYSYVVYNESTQKLGKTLEDGSFVFNIDENPPYAAGLEVLVDGEEYDALIIRNSNSEYTGAVIYRGICDYTPPEPILSDEMYGYIVNTYTSSGAFSQERVIRILNENNEIKNYTTSSKYSIDGTTYSSNYRGDFLLTDIENSSEYENTSDRIVKFSTDEDGNVRVINTTSSDPFTETYDTSSYFLGNTMSDDTVVFDISFMTTDVLYASDINVLANGNTYSGHIVSNEKSMAECIVITDGETNYTEPLSAPVVGYINEAYLDSTGISENWILSILAENGTSKNYTVAEKFRIDGTTYHTYDQTILDIIAQTNYYNEPQRRFVSFVTNSEGYITTINTFNATIGDGRFCASEQSIGSANISDDVIIFRIDNYPRIENINFLINNAEYEYLYTTDENSVIDYIVITSYSTLIDYTQSVAIVTGTDSVLYGQNKDIEAKEVKYYSDGDAEEKTVIIANDDDISYPVNCDYDAIAAGALIMFTDNGNGVASAFTVLAIAESSTNSATPAYWLNNLAISDYVQGNYGDNEVVAGYINSWWSRNGRRMLDITTDYHYVSDGNGGLTNGSEIYDMVIDSNINTYTFNNITASNINIIVGDWMGTDTIDTAYDGMATYFIAFTDGADVKDFITFSTRKKIEYVSPSTPPSSEYDESADSAATDDGLDEYIPSGSI